MDIAKSVIDLLGKFKAFFAWIAGFLYGQKLQKLKDELALEKAEDAYVEKRNAAVIDVREKWAKIREDRRISLASNNAQPMQGIEEGGLNDSNSNRDDSKL